MSKHTPGPWELDWYVCREGKKELWRVPRSIGPLSVDHNHWAGSHVAVNEDDARLIAAAPELLEALQVLCNSIETTANPFGGSSMHNMARAAIAKATGEQA